MALSFGEIIIRKSYSDIANGLKSVTRPRKAMKRHSYDFMSVRTGGPRSLYKTTT